MLSDFKEMQTYISFQQEVIVTYWGIYVITASCMRIAH